jgi:hypothetical protein
MDRHVVFSRVVQNPICGIPRGRVPPFGRDRLFSAFVDGHLDCSIGLETAL